ncbi:MAG: aldehyde dehydrogenase family protein [Luteolibacter sp.]|jgi:acyl-CoA reductase-like NAD-dependent aldehyde dehydrogenase|nr:aldehyde dehydrogenase family protein [Luteolibacter sp.]
MEFGSIIARQRAFFQSGATRSTDFRLTQLRNLNNLLESNDAELLAALHADLGKSAHEAYTSEIAFVLGEIRHAIRHLPSWVKPESRKSPLIAWPAKSIVRREPFGVALIIGPWNYPLQLLLSPLVGAIAAGNCAILKPSEMAPHTAGLLDRLIRSTFPEEFITSIQGGRETAEALLGEKFDTIFFTGSTRTGRAVMAAAARHLTPVTLELGGKCPCIVGEDAPVDLTARRIVWGKFMNAGQTCVAPDHVWAHQRIVPALVEAMRRTLVEFYGSSPKDSPNYGRIINTAHLERLTSYLKDGKITCGGECDPAALYLAPTILTRPRLDSPVMTDEIFGPILPVIGFSDIGEVLQTLRERPKPLAVYLFARDRALRERVLAGTESGGVCINDTMLQILGADLPFGGVGDSGMGACHGRAGFECFSHQRTIMTRALATDPGFRYPPPRTPLDTLKRILRFIG